MNHIVLHFYFAQKGEPCVIPNRWLVLTGDTGTVRSHPYVVLAQDLVMVSKLLCLVDFTKDSGDSELIRHLVLLLYSQI